MTLGWAFHDQAAEIWVALTRMGSWLLVVVAVALALYLAIKYWRRVIYIRALRGNRIAPSELQERLQSEAPPVVLDLRARGEVRSIGSTLPGARWVDMRRVKAKAGQLEVGEIPEGREIVLFCS